MSTPLFGFDLIQKKNLRQYLISVIESGEIHPPLPTVQTIQVEEGAVENIVPTSFHTTVVLRDGVSVNDLEIVFPPDNVSRIGQIILLTSLTQVDNLVLSGSTILNGVSSILTNDNVGFQKIEENLWVRII